GHRRTMGQPSKELTNMRSVLLLGLLLSAVACSSTPESTASGPSSSSSSSSSSTGSGGAGGGGGGGASWKQLGMMGDRVYSLVIDRKTPSTILCGTTQGSVDQGFFRSTDGGMSWPQAPGLEKVWANGLAVAPMGDVILANPGVDGFFRSTDA